MASIIELKNISKSFTVYEKKKNDKKSFFDIFRRKKKTINALTDVSFCIEEGDIVGYIGPNGAGKSTTIKIMSGILNPTQGECTICGFTPWKDRKKYVKNIGVVFGQRSQLWWDVPVIDSLELLKDIYKIPQKEYDETLALLTKTLGLEELLTRPLRGLSLGQKMKCELAGALIHRPKILFLDEPTIGLDAITKLAVRDFIKYINKEWKTTVILTTHDMNDIEALTNKIILIGRGKLLYNGNFNAIKNKYKNDVTIDVELAKDYKNVNLDGYTVLKHNKNFVTYKNNSNNPFTTTKFISDITKKYEIVDFDVSTIAIDEILAKLYKDYDL